MTQPNWLVWAKQLQAIAQSGLTFSKDPFDRERYGQIRQLAAEIVATHTEQPFEQLLGVFSAETGYP